MRFLGSSLPFPVSVHCRLLANSLHGDPLFRSLTVHCKGTRSPGRHELLNYLQRVLNFGFGAPFPCKDTNPLSSYGDQQCHFWIIGLHNRTPLTFLPGRRPSLKTMLSALESRCPSWQTNGGHVITHSRRSPVSMRSRDCFAIR